MISLKRHGPHGLMSVCFNTPEGVEGFSRDDNAWPDCELEVVSIPRRVLRGFRGLSDLADIMALLRFNTPEGVEGFSRAVYREGVAPFGALKTFQYPGGC